MPKKVAPILLFLGFFLPYVTAQAQPFIYDFNKLTCADYYDLVLSEKALENQRKVQQNPNDPPFLLKNYKAIMIIIWADGWISNDSDFDPRERIIRIASTLKDSCEQPLTLFLSSFKEVLKQYYKSNPGNIKPWSFLSLTCSQFLTNISKDFDALNWIIWLDGFFSKKETDLNITKLDKLMHTLLTECPKQPGRNLVSLIKELGNYKE